MNFEYTQEMAAFFGWAAVINMALLVFSVLLFNIPSVKKWQMNLYTKMFPPAKEEDFAIFYFLIIAIYKILTLVFNLVPYFVLRFFFL